MMIIDFTHDSQVRVYLDTAPTLQARMGTGGNQVPNVIEERLETMQIRRLLPIECERLMGWNDNHTLYRADGQQNADTQRYKMCGNGVVAPVATYLATLITPLLRTDNE